MVSYTTGVDDMIDDFIFYLISALLIFYAGYKYQKDSEFVFTIFGGKSVVSILEILLSVMFFLSAIFEITGYSNISYIIFEVNCIFMGFIFGPIFIIDTTYYRIKKKKKD